VGSGIGVGRKWLCFMTGLVQYFGIGGRDGRMMGDRVSGWGLWRDLL